MKVKANLEKDNSFDTVNGGQGNWETFDVPQEVYEGVEEEFVDELIADYISEESGYCVYGLFTEEHMKFGEETVGESSVQLLCAWDFLPEDEKTEALTAGYNQALKFFEKLQETFNKTLDN